MARIGRPGNWPAAARPALRHAPGKMTCCVCVRIARRYLMPIYHGGIAWRHVVVAAEPAGKELDQGAATFVRPRQRGLRPMLQGWRATVTKSEIGRSDGWLSAQSLSPRRNRTRRCLASRRREVSPGKRRVPNPVGLLKLRRALPFGTAKCPPMPDKVSRMQRRLKPDCATYCVFLLNQAAWRLALCSRPATMTPTPTGRLTHS